MTALLPTDPDYTNVHTGYSGTYNNIYYSICGDIHCTPARLQVKELIKDTISTEIIGPFSMA